MSELPNGWAQLRLGDVAARTKNVDPSRTPKNRFELYSVPSFSHGQPDSVLGVEIRSAKQIVQPNDVLLCKIVPHINRVWVVGPQMHHCQIASGEWIVYREHGCDPNFLRYLLTEESFREKFMETVAGVGGSLMRARPSEVSEINVALAPLPEQRRIVAKIDSLTAKSKRARGHLNHIPSLVEKYKQAVLAAAFRGDLTREWRRRHQQEKNWLRPCLGEIADIQSGVALGKKRISGTHLIHRPYLRVANVQRGWLNLREIKHVEVTKSEAERLYLRRGDILMNEGGDRDKLGRGWVWDNEITDCIHQNHVFRVRLNDPHYPPKLISLYANEFGQRHFFDEGTQTTNLASISKTKLSSLPVPLPPSDEADEIVSRIETAFAWIDRLAAEATSARKLVDHLDQAVLAKAFRGELVPQDPADEPASVLLERIRGERDATPKAKRGRKPKVDA